MTERLARAEAAALEHYPLSIPAAEGYALRDVVARERAETSIEVRSAMGCSRPSDRAFAMSSLIHCKGRISATAVCACSPTPALER